MVRDRKRPLVGHAQETIRGDGESSTIPTAGSAGLSLAVHESGTLNALHRGEGKRRGLAGPTFPSSNGRRAAQQGQRSASGGRFVVVSQPADTTRASSCPWSTRTRGRRRVNVGKSTIRTSIIGAKEDEEEAPRAQTREGSPAQTRSAGR